MTAEEISNCLNEAAQAENVGHMERAYQLYNMVKQQSQLKSQAVGAGQNAVRILEAGWSPNSGLRTLGWCLLLLSCVGSAAWLFMLSQMKIPDPQLPGLRNLTVSLLGPLAVGEAIGVVVAGLVFMYLLQKFASALDSLELLNNRMALVQLQADAIDRK